MFVSARFRAEASHHNEAPWNKTAKALSRHMIFSGLNIENSILCCELTYFWTEFLKLQVWTADRMHDGYCSTPASLSSQNFNISNVSYLRLNGRIFNCAVHYTGSRKRNYYRRMRWQSFVTKMKVGWKLCDCVSYFTRPNPLLGRSIPRTIKKELKEENQLA